MCLMKAGVFLDRDPTHFNAVLACMRTGERMMQDVLCNMTGRQQHNAVFSCLADENGTEKDIVQLIVFLKTVPLQKPANCVS